MTSPNLLHMRAAREQLKNNYGTAFLVSLIVVVISSLPEIFNTEKLRIISQILIGPISLGFTIYALNVFRQNNPTFNNVFDGFNTFLKAFLVYLLTVITVVLGLILLIVPGIILGLGLSMAYFVMVDKPELGVIDTLKESWRIMKGNKTKFFGLTLRFVPWIILGLLCLGVGILFVLPWLQVASASFYEKIK